MAAIDVCADAAIKVFSSKVAVTTPDGVYALPIVMVAIAGAESGYNAGAWAWDGDPQYGVCAGATSFGLWQIHNVHYAGGLSFCDWAHSLLNPLTNAEAAAAVLGSNPAQGLQAWTTWGNAYTAWGPGFGPYRRHLGDAQAAVIAAWARASSTSGGGTGGGGTGGGSGSTPPPPPAWRNPALAVGGLALAAAAVAALEFGLYEAVAAAAARAAQRMRQAMTNG